MATTTTDLISATRRHLMASGREQLNRLTTTMNASVASVVFDFAAGQIANGALIAIDLEVMYVWSVTSQTATVQRGMFGSIAAAHTSGALIYVNPMFTDFAVYRSLVDEMATLSSPANGLYQVKTVSTTATVASTYNLAADAVEILSVETNAYGPSLDWPRIRRWDLLFNQDTSVFASGVAVQLYQMPDPGRTLRIVYGAAYGALPAASTDVTTDTGLQTSAHDIPPIGAAARLLADREARRSSVDTQPEARQATEVPPGTANAGASALFALRKRRIVEEAARLSSQYPTVMRPAV